MDEMYEWIKMRRKRRFRLMAAILCICVLFTSLPQLPTLRQAFAAEEIRVITSFTPLADDVREQTAAPGTSLDALTLPDTLYAQGYISDAKNPVGGGKTDEDHDANPDAGESLGEEGGKEDENTANPGNPDSDDQTENDENTDPSDDAADDGENAGNPDDTTGGGENADQPDDTADDSENTGNSDDTTGDSENADQDDTSDDGENAGNPDDTTGGGENTGNMDNNAQDNDGDTGSGAQTEDAENGDSRNDSGNTDNTDSSDVKTVTAVFRAPVYQSENTANTLSIRTLTSDSANNAADTPEAGTAAADGTVSANDTALEVTDFEIPDVTWESSPAYDGNMPGVYTFTPVLPEGYETAEGVSLPVITVHVAEVEETLAVPSYDAIELYDVAPVMEREEERQLEKVSADRFGDNHKIRILWQTVKAVSKNTTTTGCSKSWISFRIPGMSNAESPKYFFTKDVLRDTSKAYVLCELALPYSYEDQETIFPTQMGLYSAVSLISGQFKGNVVFQGYDYVKQEWKTYSTWEVAPETALIGGFLAEDRWINLEQPLYNMHYYDLSADSLFISIREGSETTKNWQLVCADQFGVTVTNRSKGWSKSWKLQRKNQEPYPSHYDIRLTSNGMEGFSMTAGAGATRIPQDDPPVAFLDVYSPCGWRSRLYIQINLLTQKFLLQYVDATGVFHKDVVNDGADYIVADFTKTTPNQGRDIVCPKGHVFNGTYLGSDARKYSPGESISIQGAPINFYLNWEPAVYTLTLDPQIDENGSRTLTDNKITTLQVTYNKMCASYAPIPDHAPEGYRFDGYVGMVDGKKVRFFDKTGKPFNKWTLASDATLTVKWALKDVRYTLDPGDDAWCRTPGYTLTNPSGTTKMSDFNAKLPRSEEDIFRYGYDFVGWYTAKEGGTEFTEDTVLPLVDTVYYAHWSPKKTTVTFHANGGVFDGNQETYVRQEKIYFGQPYAEIGAQTPVPTRLGYDFKGWGYSARSSAKNALDEEDVLEETADFTLYAIWEKRALTIYLDPNGGIFANPDNALVKTYAGASKTLPSPTRTGYRLTGWKDADGVETTGSSYKVPVAADASFTLTAVWQPNNYNVRFMPNLGQGTMGSQTIAYDSTVSLTANAFTRAGYQFNEWNTKADGSGISYADRAAVSNLAASGTVSLYAQWETASYSVSFDANGGTFKNSADSSKEITYLDTYGTLPVPERERYEFLGWYTAKTNGGKVEDTTKVTRTGEHTLYARWGYTWFTLSFDLRGGSGSGENAFGNMEGSRTVGITLPGVVPTRPGWEFLGWNTDQSETPDPAYTADKILSGNPPVIKEDSADTVTLYAVWYSSNPTITYDINTGNSGDTVTDAPASELITDGKVTVTAMEPQRDGYNFVGWALTPDGVTKYRSGNVFYSSVSVTLYAVWSRRYVVHISDYDCTYTDDKGKWRTASLTDAVKNVGDNGTVILLKDINDTDASKREQISSFAKRTFTLDLNGHVVDLNIKIPSLLIYGGVNVTIKNGTVIGRIDVQSSATVVVDSVHLIDDSGIIARNEGTHVTLRGKTIIEQGSSSGSSSGHLVSISSKAVMDIEYAEIYVAYPDTWSASHICSALYVSGGVLNIEDGYFRAVCPSTSWCYAIYVSSEEGSLKLNGGYFSATGSASDADQYFTATGTGGNYVMFFRNSSEIYQGVKAPGVNPRFLTGDGVKSNNWFTPAGSAAPACFWEVYSGSSLVKSVTNPLVSNSDYAASDTRFKLMQDVSANQSLTLSNGAQKATVDLNCRTVNLTGSANVSLNSFVLQNGILDTTGSTAGGCNLANGTVEGNAAIRAKGAVTLKDMTLQNGAAFYIHPSQNASFKQQYVDAAVDFGGTWLVREQGSDTVIDGVTYACYVARPAGETDVTFHLNYPAGTNMQETAVVKRQTIGNTYVCPDASERPAPDGYTFNRWNLCADGSGLDLYFGGASICLNPALKDIYATWRRNNYDVTFNRNGGKWTDAASLGVADTSTTAKRTVAYDRAVGALPTVSRAGYGFDGWYTAASGGTKIDATEKIKAAAVYYAHWVPADGTKYTVIWQGENLDGTVVELDKKERFGKTDASVSFGANISSSGEKLVQTFNGYDYYGYNIKSSKKPNGTSGTGNGSFQILADGSVEVTLTYKLKSNSITVTTADIANTAPLGSVQIGLSAAGHTTTGSSMTTGSSNGQASTSYKYGSGVTLTAGAKEGYTFAGWSGDYTAAAKNLGFTMPDKSVDVKAYYRRNTYAVSKRLSHITAGAESAALPGQGGNPLAASSVPYAASYTLQLTADTGYELPDHITLQRGTGTAVTVNATDAGASAGSGSAVYTRSDDRMSATLTVKDVKTSLTVTAAGVPKEYEASLSDESTHVTAVPAGVSAVRYGEPFVMTLYAGEGYELPQPGAGADQITVTMGGKELSAGAYSYDPADGSVYIGAVTGDVTVKVCAQPSMSSYMVAYYRQNADGTYGSAAYETEEFFDKKTGESVALLNSAGSLETEYAKEYEGYELDNTAADSLTNGTVTADGSLALRVYYKRKEYKVNIAGGSYWSDGTNAEKTYRYGTSVSLQLQDKTGYDTGWTGSGPGGDGLSGLSNLVSFRMPMADVIITPAYRPQMLLVSEAGLTNIHFVDTELNAYYETEYTATIAPDDAYDLPGAGGVSVMVDGTALTDGEFTYNPLTGTVTILAPKVTGTIEIIAKGVHQTKQAQVILKDNTTADGQAIIQATPENGTVETASAFTTILTVLVPGYALPDPAEDPDKITVTMGGNKLEEGLDYMYSSASGIVRVADVTDDVVITVSPVLSDDTPYAVQHYKENMNGTYTLTQTVQEKGVAGTTVDADTAGEEILRAYEGFTYDKTIPGSITSQKIAIDGSTVLKLYYRRNICTLTLAAETGITANAKGIKSGMNGTVSPETQQTIDFKYGESVTASIAQVSDGVSFTGWYQGGEERSGGTSYSIVMTKDVALTAKSDQALYELVVNGNHGTSSLPEDCEEGIAHGTQKTVELMPNTGYHLPDTVTMSVDGEAAPPGSHTYTKNSETSGTASLTVTGNTELVFEAFPNHYKLTLDANGGKVTTDNAPAAAQAVIEVVYDAAYGSLPIPKRTGHTFLGWYTQPEGGEEITAETLHQIADDRTIYAQWEKLPEKKPDKKPRPNDDEEQPPIEEEDNTPEEIPVIIPTPKPPTPPQAEPDEDEAPAPVPGIKDLADDTDDDSEDTPDDGANKRKIPDDEGTVIVPAVMQDGEITPVDGEICQAGLQDIDSVVFTVMDGAVIVHVNNMDITLCRAAVTDAAATANAVLTAREMQRLAAGDTIEIRIDVTPYDDQVSEQDKALIEERAKAGISGAAEDTSGTEDTSLTGNKDGLTVGMYVDLSMFMRINEEEWQNIEITRHPVEIMLETPKQLLELSADKIFYVLRAHEGECTLLDDTDDAPETITFTTDLFSVYAIAYEEKPEQPSDSIEIISGCKLCHMCPTFLGICCFIWLALAVGAVILIVVYWRSRKKKKAEKPDGM